jgi:hypothetical protein
MRAGHTVAGELGCALSSASILRLDGRYLPNEPQRRVGAVDRVENPRHAALHIGSVGTGQRFTDSYSVCSVVRHKNLSRALERINPTLCNKCYLAFITLPSISPTPSSACHGEQGAGRVSEGRLKAISRMSAF